MICSEAKSPHIAAYRHNRKATSVNDWKATAAQLGGVSRSTVFGLWYTGGLGSVRIGRRRFSTDRQIADYIERLEKGGDAA